MSSNVGLSTPRGSGTSGYVQRNLSALKPRQQSRLQPYDKDSLDALKHRQRQPDPEILEHDRRREVEVKVFELRDRLEDEGVDEDEIDERTDALRKELLAAQQRKAGAAKTGKEARKIKGHQVHELAAAKIEESEKLRKALGISKDYQEGSHWERQREREKEKEKLREAVEAKEEEEEEEEDDDDDDE